MRDNSKQTGVALEKAYQFTLWLIAKVDKFPRSQKFLLGDRIESLALDILEGIVDATYTRNRKPILRKVNLRLEKLRLLFRLCVDLKGVDASRYEYAMRNLNETFTANGQRARLTGVGCAMARRTVMLTCVRLRATLMRDSEFSSSWIEAAL